MSYMDSRFEDNDRQALAGLSSVPAHHRKAHSHGQKSRAVSAKNRYNDQVSKHSKNIERNCESFKDNYSPYTSTASSISRGGDNSRLDQSLCIDGGGGTVDHDDPSRLPEFIGSGGENRIFRVPIREAVHPGRPTCLELRPHPLRETQGGKFLRNITCTETQLWVGQECGIRFWKFEDMYEEGCGIGGRVRRGDEDAAPFYESAETSATMCLMVDDGSRMVWSGHRDGRIRSWKMDQDINDSSHFKEGLSWQAHRGPVLAMVMSSYGEFLKLRLGDGRGFNN